MAHSQIVVVIAFPFAFEMVFLFVFHRRPLGNACLPCLAVVQLPFTIICLGMLSCAFACFDMGANCFCLAPASCGFLPLICIC